MTADATQGPQWFADLLYTTDPAVARGLAVLVVIAFIALFYGAYRVGVDQNTAKGMLANFLIVMLMGGSTWLLKTYAWFPYLGDVVGGAALGYLIYWASWPLWEEAVENAY
jgi:hypothetical protein